MRIQKEISRQVQRLRGRRGKSVLKELQYVLWLSLKLYYHLFINNVVCHPLQTHWVSTVHLNRMASPSPHDRSRKEDDEDDPVERMISRTGCAELHYAVQECMAEHQDWRLCQSQVQTFKDCMMNFQNARKEQLRKQRAASTQSAPSWTTTLHTHTEDCTQSNYSGKINENKQLQHLVLDIHLRSVCIIQFVHQRAPQG